MSSLDGESGALAGPAFQHKEHKEHKEVPAEVGRLARIVFDAGLKVHRTLGPGLLESVYEQCLAHELKLRGVRVERQVPLGVTYEGLRLEAGYRLDMLVEGCVVVEVKAVEQLSRLYEAQVLTYLKLSGHRLGLLMNFNVPLLKDGTKRFVL